MTRKLIIPLCLTIFFGWGINQSAAQTPQVKKDLAADWLVYEDGQYQKFENHAASTIYLKLNTNQYAGDVLHLESREPFSLFINGKLSSTNSRFLLDIDSLSKLFEPTLLISIHQPSGMHQLSTTIESHVRQTAGVLLPEKRKPSHFRDFTVVAALALIILLITMIRLNPKLASDYFSPTKIFSIHDGDDSQLYSRITSSTNILFYVFCSLMLGFYMMVVFQFVAERYPIALQFQNLTFWDAMWNWLRFSMVLLLFFFAKIVVVYGLSRLFGFQGIAGVHFFNWARVIIVIFGVACVILSFYFIARGQSEGFFNVLFKFLSWTLAGWMILILLKLRSKTEHSVFHLFSYICATELIPFLFIIKILYT
ncbi:MAG TPA: DUF4271 domain-containing protein [Cyclobacteriaceae bacterium]